MLHLRRKSIARHASRWECKPIAVVRKAGTGGWLERTLAHAGRIASRYPQCRLRILQSLPFVS